MLSSAIFPLKLRIVWSGPFPMFLVLASFTSIMSVVRWVRVIRVITRGRVWRVIFSMLATLFLSLRLFLLFSESDDEECDESDGGRSGSDVTFGLCFLQSDVEIGSDRIVSIRVGISEIGSDRIVYIRVGISSIVSRSSIFCSSIRVILSWVTIFSMFSRALWSRCNIRIVSKSNSLRYLRNANF